MHQIFPPIFAKYLYENPQRQRVKFTHFSYIAFAQYCKLENLPFDIICASRLTYFLKLCFCKIICFSEQTPSADKHLSIFSDQMKAIIYSTCLSGKWIEDLHADTLKNFIQLNTSLKLLKDASTTSRCNMVNIKLIFLYS